MREVNVEGLQCTQAVMTVLREMVSMEEGEEIHISYEEPNARRDIMAMVKRRDYTLVSEEEKLIILSK
ncbi:MAG: sulfurtransferase TusA family protein [Candidatus Thermoplasmatota archaeon]|jgi:TusA-related sulfurtransferase|nr:sulfurtransferase TusA family protein [Candidatus Thermoplasmatota archaeon]MEC7697582.1 sulfurtransferase TusA family protein [Candidatus Thermoplasmatota archaeon]MEC7976396.1 sulfurtransferase TusA family protein [Candidatus Thermoplasmatota archaeon]MEC8077304.1 sulfurtransferase TusA family protein [Candidatus Thermoplasmatota archaeon]MEC8216807.1 sulfurtransferase TusA family protein [Candidatus Thermoplasmatota archaeon]|tara:strand:- start:36 stop:239 length:204 start_codon:yes stop_codon:yes gene_type:complete